jgi:hypothetical protein
MVEAELQVMAEEIKEKMLEGYEGYGRSDFEDFVFDDEGMGILQHYLAVAKKQGLKEALEIIENDPADSVEIIDNQANLIDKISKRVRLLP